MTLKRKARTPRVNFVLRAENNSNVDSSSTADRFAVKHDDRFLSPSINYVEGNTNPILNQRRVEQIRNMFNIKDPNQPLTRELFDFAKRYYTVLLMDNNMLDFFNSIKDPDKFLEIVNNNRRVI